MIHDARFFRKYWKWIFNSRNIQNSLFLTLSLPYMQKCWSFVAWQYKFKNHNKHINKLHIVKLKCGFIYIFVSSSFSSLKCNFIHLIRRDDNLLLDTHFTAFWFGNTIPPHTHTIHTKRQSLCLFIVWLGSFRSETKSYISILQIVCVFNICVFPFAKMLLTSRCKTSTIATRIEATYTTRNILHLLGNE